MREEEEIIVIVIPKRLLKSHKLSVCGGDKRHHERPHRHCRSCSRLQDTPHLLLCYLAAVGQL